MPPVIVTTPASADANAYIDADEADAYADADIGPDAAAWRSSINTDEKDRAILRATTDVDRYVGRVSYPYDPDTPQALVFPRAEDVDSFSDPYITSPIKRATYVQAVYLFQNADSIDKARTRRARALTNFAEPNVSGSIATEADFGQFAPELADLLGEYREGDTVGWIETT